MFPALLEAVQGFTLTSDMLTGFLNSISSNAAVIVPTGIGAMAVMVSIKIIPRVVRYFI